MSIGNKLQTCVKNTKLIVRLLDPEDEGTALLRNVGKGVIYLKRRMFIISAVRTSSLYSSVQFLNISMVYRKHYFIHVWCVHSMALRLNCVWLVVLLRQG